MEPPVSQHSPRRAVSDAAKADRRELILATAAELFTHIGFRDLSMSLIARRVGLAKGTLYLYFPTKEALFLALYQRELAAWMDAVTTGLDSLPRGDGARLAGLLVDSLDSSPQLPALASLLHTVLERNIPFDEALAFRRALLQRSAPLAEGLESRLDFLAAGDGMRLLLRWHGLLLGCWQAATPAPVARKALEQPGLEELRMDFTEELENMLVLLLEGWRQVYAG